VVPQAPEDALFGLMRAYKADSSPDKVDLVRRGSPLFRRPPRGRCANWSVLGHRCLPRRQRKALGLASGQEGTQLSPATHLLPKSRRQRLPGNPGRVDRSRSAPHPINLSAPPSPTFSAQPAPPPPQPRQAGG
jgi:hypothetical protein